ncbi:hypothetical protein F5878DRAFT_664878 [Lentinula raphanica]|uniref:F-box domain-containing protein n=1 Tax=Lentinula raphanica TaxID=153919 RepID=A0AA38U8J4_9AGAR|nr:hypothetical protein F5878DRAFT_664878 [Lentinula raphanica]
MLRRSQRFQTKKDAPDGVQMQEMPAASGSNSAAGSKRTRDDEDDNESQDEDHEEEDDEDDDDDDAPKRKRKRSKKTAKASAPSITGGPLPRTTRKKRIPDQFRGVRGKLGLLEKLVKDMPLDVILEIFCYLEPRDLLRLARTTKEFRGILMSKTSEGIWRIARGNVEGLPPRPDDLNEPQYANLLFEPYCHVCLNYGRCENVLWNFRMRSCQKCLRTFPKLSLSQRDHFLIRYGGIIPMESVRINSRISRTPKSHNGIKQSMMRSKKRKTAMHGSSARAASVSPSSRLVCEEFANSCDELDALRNDRKAAILVRLEEIGWRDEAEIVMEHELFIDVDNSDRFSNHGCVKQPKKLTDYGWHSIKDDLVNFLSRCRDVRRAHERETVLTSRIARTKKIYDAILLKSDLREPFPTIGDILCHRVFQTLIWETSEEDLTEDFLHSKLLEHLPEITKEWRVIADQKLLEILQKSRPTAAISELHLVTTTFRCNNCYQYPLYYPQLFDHYCATAPSFPDNVQRPPITVRCSGPWSHLSFEFCDRDSFSGRNSSLATKVVEACSLDPSTATYQDVYDANPLFECTTCKGHGQYWNGGRCFMRWPLPLVHPPHHDLTINALNDEEMEKVIACEPTISSHSSIRCAHCHETTSVDDMIRHLKSEHSDVLDFPESEKPLKLQALRAHWYWNPRTHLSGRGEPFRYTEEPSSQTSHVVTVVNT